MRKQQLNLFSLTMIVISLVIGMGIFKTPATIAAKSGTPTIFFAAWAIGGIIALFGALIYAEIGLRLPSVGGYYSVFAECYHPSVGFTVNILILISNAASISVVALIGADYVSDLLFGKPSGELFIVLVATLPIAIFYGVNLLGLKTSSRTQNILMLLKIGLIILLISACFTGLNIAPHGYNTSAKVYSYNGHNAGLLLMVSLVAVFFTYGGYQQTINFGGETKTPATLQTGIIAGIAIVLFLYLSISYAYVQVIGFDKMKNATAIGALLCETWFGKAGGKVFDACMFLSVLGYVNVSLLSNPRVMYAMSKDGVFPKIFAYKHPRTEALVPGLTAFAIIAIVVAFFGKGVDNVLDFSIFLDCIGFSFSAAALLILKRRRQGNGNVTGFVQRITSYLCVVFVLAYFVVATAVVIDNPSAAITGIALMALFFGVYYGFYNGRDKGI
jgi:APA family basic amino acid/polyamine antiporter